MARGNSGTKDKELNKTIKRVHRCFGQRLHTNTRLFKFQFLTLKDELELAEKKFLWKLSQNKLPLGVKNILEGRTNVLRGYRFKI